jgi:sporulation protein YlmC with PRC-barrel domain
MTSEYRQRADLLGTQVITRSNGRRLGVVSQLWVDVDSQEVVAFSLRPSLFYGTPQQMMLKSVRQIGDVILVENDDVIEDVDTDRYNSLINCEVITETGDVLGKVRGFKFDVDNGKLTALTIASFGYPLIPDRVVSTYELPIEEIVSSGPDRLIVYEGAEERLSQLTVGFLEQVGIGKPPWEKDDTFAPPPLVRPENQLPSATRVPMQAPAMRRPDPDSAEEAWDEDNWEREPERIEVRPPQRQAPQRAQAMSNPADNRADNWNDTVERDQYQERFNDADADDAEDYRDAQDVEFAEVSEVEVPKSEVPKSEAPIDEEPASADPWTATPPADYQPQAFKIPEKVKEPEYEE